MADISHYRVLIDNEWMLSDLHDFPSLLGQVYAFSYCFDTHLKAVDAERIDRALRDYPWQGGYSVVNFYRVLHNQLPDDARPRIKSMHYASPGWIELALDIEAMRQVASYIGIFVGFTYVAAIGAAAGLTKIDKGLQSYDTLKARYDRTNRVRLDYRKSSKENAETTHAVPAHSRDKMIDEERLLAGAARELADALQFIRYDELVHRTRSELNAATLICAQYRRLEAIAEYVRQEKAKLP